MAELPKIVYGAYPITSLSKDEFSKLYSLLKENDVLEWDTARLYPGSEKSIGDSGIAGDLVIGTKARSFEEGALTRAEIFESIKQSFDELKVESVEIYYLHAPDPATPVEETIDAINELYKQGKFKKFGLSNYNPDDVEKIYEYAKSKNYILPTVFQGNYNAFARGIEKDLFPVLRKYGISFYAYSPIAGGFLVKSAQQIEEGVGRFKKGTRIGDLYCKLYTKPKLLGGLRKWADIAKKYDIPKSHLAYRWIAFHSSLNKKDGDAIIIGGKNYEQVADTINAFDEGPLPEEAVAEIEDLWESIKDEAPVNNYIISRE